MIATNVPPRGSSLSALKAPPSSYRLNSLTSSLPTPPPLPLASTPILDRPSYFSPKDTAKRQSTSTRRSSSSSMASPSRPESPTLGRAITLKGDDSTSDDDDDVEDLRRRLQTREALIRQRMRLRNRQQSPSATPSAMPPSPTRSTTIRSSCYSMSSLRSPVTDTFQLESQQPINYSRPLAHQRSASSLRSPTIAESSPAQSQLTFNRRLSAYFADPYRGPSSPRAASPSCSTNGAGRRRSIAPPPPPTPPPCEPLPTPPAAMARRRKISHDSTASAGSSRSSTSLEKIQEEDRSAHDEDVVSPVDHVDDAAASSLGLFGTWRRKKGAPQTLHRTQNSLANVELIKAIQEPLESGSSSSDDEDATFHFGGGHARNASTASDLTLAPTHESLLDFPIPPSRRPSDDSTHRMSILTLSSGTSAASSHVHLTPTQPTMRDSVMMSPHHVDDDDDNDELMREEMSGMMSDVKHLGLGPSPESKKRFARRPGPEADYWGEPEIITDRP